MTYGQLVKAITTTEQALRNARKNYNNLRGTDGEDSAYEQIMRTHDKLDHLNEKFRQFDQRN